jgi:DNA-binding MarR family transcriptional regulator
VPNIRKSLQLKIVNAVSQTARRWQQRSAEAYRGKGHAGAPMSLLYVLSDAGRGLTHSEIADRMKITGASVTRLVDWLEEAGLVSRRRLIGDGRSRLVVMQEKGVAALCAFDGLAGAMRNRIFEGVPEEELATTLRVLDTIANRLITDPGLREDVVVLPDGSSQVVS